MPIRTNAISLAPAVAGPALLPVGRDLLVPPFYLDRSATLIGSRRRADICLKSDEVSRSHAVLVKSDGRVILRDLGSRTHTYVNGQGIDEVELADGDHVSIGQFVLRFYAENAPYVGGAGPEAPAADVPAAPRATLSGDGTRAKVLSLDAPLCVIGSRPGVDVVLYSSEVSYAHAIIFRHGGRHMIRDLGSRAGTFVDEVAVEGDAVLRPDSVIRVGSYRMRYALVAEPKGIAAPAPTIDTPVLEDVVASPEALAPADAAPPLAAEVVLENTPAVAAEVETPGTREMDEERPASLLPLAVWRPVVQFLSTSEGVDTSAADSELDSPPEFPSAPPVDLVATVQEMPPAAEVVTDVEVGAPDTRAAAPGPLGDRIVATAPAGVAVVDVASVHSVTQTAAEARALEVTPPLDMPLETVFADVPVDLPAIQDNRSVIEAVRPERPAPAEAVVKVALIPSPVRVVESAAAAHAVLTAPADELFGPGIDSPIEQPSVPPAKGTAPQARSQPAPLDVEKVADVKPQAVRVSGPVLPAATQAPPAMIPGAPVAFRAAPVAAKAPPLAAKAPVAPPRTSAAARTVSVAPKAGPVVPRLAPAARQVAAAVHPMAPDGVRVPPKALRAEALDGRSVAVAPQPVARQPVAMHPLAPQPEPAASQPPPTVQSRHNAGAGASEGTSGRDPADARAEVDDLIAALGALSSPVPAPAPVATPPAPRPTSMLPAAPILPPPQTWGVLAAAIAMSEVPPSEGPGPVSPPPRRSAWAKWAAAGVIVAAGAYTAVATGACAAALRLVH